MCAASSPSTNDDGRYILLQSDNGDGDFLTVGADGLLSTTDVLDDGSLWRPNQLVRVTDRRKRLLDAQLLITRVGMSLGAGGRKTVLDLAPAAGFTPYVPGVPILAGAGRWFGEVEGTTRPDAAELRKLGVK